MNRKILVTIGFLIVSSPSFGINNPESIRMLVDISNSDNYITHSGRTDRYGCHNDRKRGTYHCH
jgi:hypothetical protein